MYGVYNFLYRILEQMTELVYLIQIFEWVAMNYVIKSQKGRKVGEILYDYNTENLLVRDTVTSE